MFDPRYNQHDKLYQRRQRLMAEQHRRYMRLRELRRNHQSHHQTPVVDVRPNAFQRFIVWLLKNIVYVFFWIRDTFLVIKTQIRISWLNSVFYLKKTLLYVKNFFSSTKTHISKEVKNYYSIHRDLDGVVEESVVEPKNNPLKKHKLPRLFHNMKQKITKTKKTNKKPNIFFWLKKLFLIGLTLGFIGSAVFGIWFSTLEIPSVQNFQNRKISNSTKIYDKTGEILLYDIHDNIQRTVVSFGEINQSAKDAIVAIEDHSFYEHGGVVWKSTVRAVFQTILSKSGISAGGTAGGSTLTQQVVKNTLLNRDKVISRKVKEWVLAYKIERQLTKDEILEIYLNEAPYGGTIYGIQEASKRFFGIPASELSIAQSAYLAAIPNLPTYYSPYGDHVDELKQRQRVVLGEMKRYGFISDAQYRSALEEVVEFLPEDVNHAKSLHFVQYVREQLEATYGVDMVENGGLQVITTLDYELQQQAEEIIKSHIEEVESVYDASNAGLVAIDTKTGQIITMVGSRDYTDTDGFDGNFNVTLAKRQPGSSFKPIAYVTAFEKGYTPESTIFDTQTQFNVNCDATNTETKDGCYAPKNYDNKFKGPLTFRGALAESRNIPAIKINYLSGLSNVIQTAKDLGITSLTERPDFYGLGLVLGGGEVSPLEMTSAYATFANDGVYNKPIAILEVRDIDGNLIEEFTSNEERVLDKNAVRMLNSVLSDNVARTPLFGANSFLNFGDRDVAGKTGTTNDNRDAWLIGYSPDVAVSVWTGNNDNRPMKKGSSISGKPWRAYMDEVLKKYPKSSFPNYDIPDDFSSFPNMVNGAWYGGTTVYIDTVSGKLANEFTPEETKLAVPQPDPHTILYWIDKNNPRVPNNSQSDPQFRNWEYGVQQYVQTYLADIINIKFNIPTETDDVHTEDGVVQGKEFTFKLSGIDTETNYETEEPIVFEVVDISIDENDIENAQVFINNAFIASDERDPFEFEILPSELKYFEAKNIMRVILTSKDGIKSTQELVFGLNI